MPAEDTQWIAGIKDVVARRDNFVVDHRNWRAFEVFVACSTQWRTISTMGDPPIIYQGLDYAAVKAVLDLHNLSQRRRLDTFDRVRMMERGAILAYRDGEIEDMIERAKSGE